MIGFRGRSSGSAALVTSIGITAKDESVVVLSGEAFLMQPNGQAIRFGAGDVGYFPAGTTCTWRVPGQFRKIAVLREPMCRSVGYAAKAWNQLVRMIGLAGRSSSIVLRHASTGESHQVS